MNIPPSIVESNDSFLLRHFHGVIPIYIIKFFISEKDSPIEQGQSIWNLKATLLFIFLLAFVYLIYILKDSSASLTMLVLTLSIFLTSPIVFESFYLLNYHVVFSLLIVFFSIYIVKILKTGRQKYLLHMFFVLGLMFNTLETASLIILLSIVFIIIEGWHRSSYTYPAIYSFILSVILIYPGQIYSLDYIKSTLMYVYRIFVKDGSEYSSNSLDVVTDYLIQTSHALLLLIFVMFVLRVVRRAGVYKSSDAILYIGLVYTLFMAPFSLSPSYLLPGISLIFVWVLIEMAGLSINIRLKPIFISVLAFMSIYNINFGFDRVISDYENRRYFSNAFYKDVAFMGSFFDKYTGYVVSDIPHVLNFYTGRDNFVLGYIEDGELLVRIDGESISISKAKEKIDIGVIAIRANRVSAADNFPGFVNFNKSELVRTIRLYTKD
jgi:hypothetical protein